MHMVYIGRTERMKPLSGSFSVICELTHKRIGSAIPTPVRVDAEQKAGGNLDLGFRRDQLVAYTARRTKAQHLVAQRPLQPLRGRDAGGTAQRNERHAICLERR